MKRRLWIKEADWRRIGDAFNADERETAAYGLIGISRYNGGVDYLVREVHFLEELDYDDRNRVHLLISPRYINKMAGLCERTGLGLLAMHSHPMQRGAVHFSPSDDWGEEREFRVFDQLGSGNWPLVSLVRGPSRTKARAWTFRGKRTSVNDLDELVIVGKTILRISLGPAGEREALPPTDVYDRQVRAFGREGQQALARTTVAIIGAGGTGSACGEMLARLGVGRAILIDDDSLELSNVSRVFGSTPAGVGKAKVDLLAAWMRRINPAMKVQPHAVNLAGHVSLLKEADIVLSCTDTETSRSLANQFASQFLRPLVDLGNRIDASEGRVVAASARLTHVVPGGPCMECFNSINHSAVRAENLSKAEYSKLRAEGYVEGLTEPAPSVVSLNAFVASLAITKFLDIVTGIGGLPHPKYTFSYLEGELRAASVGRREKCICRYFEAYGDLKQVDFTITG